MNNMILVCFAFGAMFVIAGVIVDSKSKHPGGGGGTLLVGPGAMLMALGIILFLLKAFRVVWAG